MLSEALCGRPDILAMNLADVPAWNRGEKRDVSVRVAWVEVGKPRAELEKTYRYCSVVTRRDGNLQGPCGPSWGPAEQNESQTRRSWVLPVFSVNW